MAPLEKALVPRKLQRSLVCGLQDMLRAAQVQLASEAVVKKRYSDQDHRHFARHRANLGKRASSYAKGLQVDRQNCDCPGVRAVLLIGLVSQPLADGVGSIVASQFAAIAGRHNAIPHFFFNT